MKCNAVESLCHINLNPVSCHSSVITWVGNPGTGGGGRLVSHVFLSIASPHFLTVISGLSRARGRWKSKGKFERYNKLDWCYYNLSLRSSVWIPTDFSLMGILVRSFFILIAYYFYFILMIPPFSYLSGQLLVTIALTPCMLSQASH